MACLALWVVWLFTRLALRFVEFFFGSSDSLALLVVGFTSLSSGLPSYWAEHITKDSERSSFLRSSYELTIMNSIFVYEAANAFCRKRAKLINLFENDEERRLKCSDSELLNWLLFLTCSLVLLAHDRAPVIRLDVPVESLGVFG